MAYIVNVEGREFNVDVTKGDTGFLVSLDGRKTDVEVAHEEGLRFTLIMNNRPYSIVIESENQLLVNGEAYTVDVVDEQVQRLIKASPSMVQRKELVMKAVMPGLVIDVNVREGDTVKAGDGLMVIEAMKMQNDIKSGREGCVRKIHVKPGQTVNTGDVLITIE